MFGHGPRPWSGFAARNFTQIRPGPGEMGTGAGLTAAALRIVVCGAFACVLGILFIPRLVAAIVVNWCVREVEKAGCYELMFANLMKYTRIDAGCWKCVHAVLHTHTRTPMLPQCIIISSIIYGCMLHNCTTGWKGGTVAVASVGPPRDMHHARSQMMRKSCLIAAPRSATTCCRRRRRRTHTHIRQICAWN